MWSYTMHWHFSIHRRNKVLSFSWSTPLQCEISTSMKWTLNQYYCHKWNIKVNLVSLSYLWLWESHVQNKVVSKSDSKKFASQTRLLVWKVGTRSNPRVKIPHFRLILWLMHDILISKYHLMETENSYPGFHYQWRSNVRHYVQVYVRSCCMSMTFCGQMMACGGS